MKIRSQNKERQKSGGSPLGLLCVNSLNFDKNDNLEMIIPNWNSKYMSVAKCEQ